MNDGHPVRFWEHRTLEELSDEEWEQLCDGCGLCCLVRIQDEDTEEIFDTSVVCTHYDCDRVGCSSYDDRTRIKDGCVQLTPELVREFDWLPDSCAYRTLMRGDDLPETHPLISGTPTTTRNIVEIFAQSGLTKNSVEVEPLHYLIAKEDFDYQ